METQTRNIKKFETMIGNTPLLEIIFKYKGEVRRIYTKIEYYNITGSIKDRIAYYILNKAIEKGSLPEDAVIIEATSGNTGISFSAISSAIGRKTVIFMPDWMSEERKSLIRSYGAEVILVSKEEGGFLGSIEKSKEFAKTIKHSFLPSQFDNEDNVLCHYATTGLELLAQLEHIGLTPDAFTAGVGTGGTIMGIGKRLKEHKLSTKIYPLEPSNSPTMTTGHKVGKHRIQGISDEFIPSIMKLNQIDDIIAVDDGDSIIMAQKLSSELGLGVGISSGANFIGAIMAQDMTGKNCVSTTVFSDDNKKYLSTDLMKDEPIKENYISKDVELLEARSIHRICKVCELLGTKN